MFGQNLTHKELRMLIRGMVLLTLFLLASPAWAFPDNGGARNLYRCGYHEPAKHQLDERAAHDRGHHSRGEDYRQSCGNGNRFRSGEAYWDTTEFGPNQEAYATLTVVGNPSRISCVHVRLRQMGRTRQTAIASVLAIRIPRSRPIVMTNSAGTEIGSSHRRWRTAISLG